MAGPSVDSVQRCPPRGLVKSPRAAVEGESVDDRDLELAVRVVAVGVLLVARASQAENLRWGCNSRAETVVGIFSSP